MTGKNWRFWTNSAIFSPPIISPVMIKHAIIFPSKVDSIVLSTRQGDEPGKSCQGTIPWILTVQSKFLKGLVFE